MSKIKNSGSDHYGAEPFQQQQFETSGVERVKRRLCEKNRTYLQQSGSPSRPASSLSSATSLTVQSVNAYHDALPNGSSCSLHVPRRGGVVTNGWRAVRGSGGVGGGRRSSSPDDDSAVLVDNRSDGDEESDGATRTAPPNSRSTTLICFFMSIILFS